MLSCPLNLPNFGNKSTCKVRGQTGFAPLNAVKQQTTTLEELQMKFNKWTLGLAAVGAVSMASAVRADEAKLSALNTALSNTTISGYVDVAAQFNTGDAPNRNSSSYVTEADKRDAFSLNNVTISLDKPLDDSPWAAGYHIDLNTGVDAINGFNSRYSYNANQGTLGIRQAYIALRTPLGNGIDWKIGVMDGITGYEGNTSHLNPNYSRSFGYAINPTSYTGLLATYKFCDLVSATAGIVNRGQNQGSGQSNRRLSSKDYVASVSLTAPESFGFLKGSSLNFQTIQGFDNNAVAIYSLNGTLNTPLAGLKIGAAYDVLNSVNRSDDGYVVGVYAVYQATDKLSFAVRAEYVDAADLNFGTAAAQNGTSGDNVYNNGFSKGEEVTATVAYNLWANVLTRLEVRWDHEQSGTFQSGNNEGADLKNQVTIALNVVYKF